MILSVTKLGFFDLAASQPILFAKSSLITSKKNLARIANTNGNKWKNLASPLYCYWVVVATYETYKFYQN